MGRAGSGRDGCALPRLRRHKSSALYATGNGITSLALGWQVTVFMGLQSVAFYVCMAWLPTIEQSRGVPAATAGVHLSVFLLISVFSSLATGQVLHRGPDQRYVSFISSSLMLVTFLGLVTAPDLILLGY